MREIKRRLNRSIKEFQTALVRRTPDALEQKGGSKRLKNLSLEIASLLLKSTHNNKIPVDLRPICQKRMIHSVIIEQKPSISIASLIPDQKGFTIKLFDRAEIRGRVAIAHEIGHTLFYDTDELPPTPLLTHNTVRWSKSDKEEWISWDFAREILLPRDVVISEMKQQSLPSPEKIVKLARNWKVSLDVFCRRIILDLGIWPESILFLLDLKSGLKQSNMTVFRGKYVPRFGLLGKNGLFAKSDQFEALVHRLKKEEKAEACLEWSNEEMWIQLLRYSKHYDRVIGVLEIPNLYKTSELNQPLLPTRLLSK